MRLTYVLDAFPVLTETFVASEIEALRDQGHIVDVEAALRTDREASSESALGCGVAFAWCVATRPGACVRDLRARARWRAGGDQPRTLRELAPVALRILRRRSDHLHAHFAAGAALDACRLATLTGRPWSFTAHAYDIFRTPRNLGEKLVRADVVVTVCAYNRKHLERIGRRPVETVVMGVDLDRFRRSRPYEASGTILAVGRLVPKKGFDVLVRAAALSRTGHRFRIVGEGPEREHLERLVAELDVSDRVDLLGARQPSAVRDLLDSADVLVAPCVVAPDGDRDSMPVVVKEAMAMEVPVIASDEVGLPEIVRADWGRVVAPGDAAALAQALDEMLALPVAARAALGRRGRAAVAERADLRRETARLVGFLRRRA